MLMTGSATNVDVNGGFSEKNGTVVRN